MNDANILAKFFSEGKLVQPDAKKLNFVDLTRSLASIAGAKGVEQSPGSRHLQKLIGSPRHIVFVLVDGMGDELLEKASPEGFLRSNRVGRIQAVFPSTTASVLTSLATASWPKDHASCGWWMYLTQSDLSITTLPFVERFSQTPLQDYQISIRDVLPLSSIWANTRYSFSSFLKDELVDSAYAKYMCPEDVRRGYSDLEDLFKHVALHISESKNPTCSYVYLPQFDASCHDHGIEDSIDILKEIDRHLASFAKAIAGKARLVVSADHGMVDLPQDRVRILEGDDNLLDTLVVPPSGEPTMPIFHLREGCKELFLERFKALAGHLFMLLNPDDVEQLGLFGPGKLSELTRERLGDFIGIPQEPAAMFYRPEGNEPFIFRAVHAGLSPDEMWIPLILA